ncbi:MAG: hypothetical protein IKE89_00355 [Bacilli bacterium]|nr:hypothetical protein [Bacilli bacterium]
MKIKTIINDITYNTTVENNLPAKEFLEILPLNIYMEKEKDSYVHYIEYKLDKEETIPKKLNAGDILLEGNNKIILVTSTNSNKNKYTRLASIDNPDNLELILEINEKPIRFENKE